MFDEKKVFYVLKKYYGFDTFREGQLEVIKNILNNKDTFSLMPTGAGKSLCFQIPAILFSGITIVISPLISLMKDQVDNLNDIGIKAEFINSTKKLSEIDNILDNIKNRKIKILYIAPERLSSENFKDKIRLLDVNQVAVDEAHCVSQWGHDFRRSYLKIAGFVKSLKKRPVISAFTATATDEVRRDLVNLLELKNPYVFLGNINRENLYLNVFIEPYKLEDVKSIISEHEDESGIIYCASRREVDELYKYLNELSYSVLKYHGGLSDEEKDSYQESFLYDKKNVMIATNAFGMGIDKSNIRFIVHFTIPKNIESYYQEIGRGGRDGEKCSCYLFYSENDIPRIEYIINKSSSINRREIALKKFQSMIDYCKFKECYRNFILNYFGNKYKLTYCMNCGNCLKDTELKDFSKESQIILSTVFRTREKYGISILCDILKGFKGPKIIQNRLFEITTYGLMKEYSTSFIKDLIKNLLKDGFVDLKEGTYSMLKLNKRSYSLLKGKEKAVFKIFEKEQNILNKDLFMKLKLWRKEKAYSQKIKPYIIFSDTTLIDISNLCPKTQDELLNIRGVGEKKIKSYGDEILKIISD
ncbi:DNA helicase RecQ [Clostridium sp. BJN0001]|uniref:DNA helicase RecQ n=1 Tax=Clostridium sp. BJN0001 TaxID=2930219 RepID=UPI001FD26AB1|nr:DNA helicase RecQ [Clostridium sp. BJN0001]